MIITRGFIGFHHPDKTITGARSERPADAFVTPGLSQYLLSKRLWHKEMTMQP
jgi:hypothetical protein